MMLSVSRSTHTGEVSQFCEPHGKTGTSRVNHPMQLAQLERARRQLTTLLLSGPIGVVITDSTGRFALANRAFCDITGYNEHELRELSWVSITHPDDRAAIFALTCRVLEEDELCSFVVEKRYIARSGRTVWTRNSIFPMCSEAGEYAGAVVLAEDITELKRAQQAHRAMSRHLVQLQDQERRRIARELHDSTGQTLAGLLMILSPLKKQIANLDPDARRALKEGIALAKKAACEVRTFSYLLHPPLLDELGLSDALRSYVQGFRQRSGMDVKLLLPPNLPPLLPGVDLALFRILQESLNNSRRHSGSSRATVRLRHVNGHLLLTIRDFGRGFKLSKRRRRVAGVGIAGMHERVRQLGGRLRVVSGKRGTLVHASVPVNTHDHPPAAAPESRPALLGGQ